LDQYRGDGKPRGGDGKPRRRWKAGLFEPLISKGRLLLYCNIVS
jgi:hypothetical protein